jgi:hypothetical protein
MKYFISIYLFALVCARPELPPRAVGSSCATPDVNIHPLSEGLRRILIDGDS